MGRRRKRPLLAALGCFQGQLTHSFHRDLLRFHGVPSMVLGRGMQQGTNQQSSHSNCKVGGTVRPTLWPRPPGVPSPRGAEEPMMTVWCILCFEQNMNGELNLYVG